MRRGLSIFFGMILIIAGLLKLLPLAGINIQIDGFDLNRWFPVVFILIGLLELAGQEGSGWFWGVALLIYGSLTFSQTLGFAVPMTEMLDLQALLIPLFVLIYGIKSLAVSH
jgi:hypothetical protein